MKAKWANPCPACGSPIAKGDEIELRESKWLCRSCVVEFDHAAYALAKSAREIDATSRGTKSGADRAWRMRQRRNRHA